MDNEIKELNSIAKEIEIIARNLGLDFYPVHFEVCPADALYTFGAYGMPVRFTHWSFGKAFHRLKIQYDLNISRIYELVINSNPAYAFLLEGNRLIQNKLVIGHVYAHVDFFKNNHNFQRTPRDMVSRMETHAQQIREYELKYGLDKVEQTLDAVLAIQEHVDPRWDIADVTKSSNSYDELGSNSLSHSPYEDLWQLDHKKEHTKSETKQENEDILLYLIQNAPGLEEWQRDIISMIRAESLYFYPQIETKIMNEGWATFWHSRIMRELDITGEELVDFALTHSQVVQPSQRSLNPYYLGVKIWEHLAENHDMDFLFEVREVDNDVSFIRNYLNRDLVEKLNLYNFRKVGAQWQVTDVGWKKVRDNLVQQLVHGGNPYIVAVDKDYENKGGLLLRHRHEGNDLDIGYLERTLILLQRLWGKPVHLETLVDGKKILFEAQNGIVTRRHILKNETKE